MEVLEPELVVDIDVAAHVQRAGRHYLLHQVGAGLGLGDGAGRTNLALGLDAVGDGVARGLVRHPWQAEQRLVEMDVAVDQRRHHQHAGFRLGRRLQGNDAAVPDLDVVLAAVGQHGVADHPPILADLAGRSR